MYKIAHLKTSASDFVYFSYTRIIGKDLYKKEDRMKQSKSIYAVLLALAAVLAYAVSVPAEKYLLKDVGPATMAALLYLGAGTGMSVVSLFSHSKKKNSIRMSHTVLPYLIGMVALDIVGAVLFMNGVQRSTAANASLLGNLEIAATAVIAYFVFHEKVSRRMCAALFLMMLAGMILSLDSTSWMRFTPGSIMIIVSALCWGMENNCTKMLSERNITHVVMIKGFGTGIGSLLIALCMHESMPSVICILISLCLGFLAYGISIFAYIKAQSLMGASRTSALYSMNPFVSALLSFVFLKEGFSNVFFLGLCVMAAGSLLTILDLWKTEQMKSAE
jgi:drug/metabolite transporter (DMT)-like permease